MKSIQSSRLKAYTMALAHIRENEAITREVDEIAPLYAEALSLIGQIANADTRKVAKIGGVSEGKLQLQDTLTEQAVAIAKVIASYATKKNDPELRQAMRFSRTELFYGAGQELSTKSNIILLKARELAGELTRFGITPEVIETFAGTITMYSDSLLQPRIAVSDRKEAGMQLTKLFRRLQQLFILQLDPLILLLKAKHPAFYDSYLLRRMVVNPAQRKTRVEGVVLDKATQKALPDVAISVEGLEMMPSSTNATGNYSLQTPLLKRLPVLYHKPGYKPLTVDTTVSRGKTTTLNVELESI